MSPDQVTQKYGPVLAVVNSRSEPEKTYNVRRKDGVLSCNCKGWIFNKQTPRRCKHIDAVQSMNDRMAKQVVFDLAAEIAEKMSWAIEAVADHAVRIKVMADMIRPHLGKVQAVAPRADAGLLVGAGPRRIVLDD
jgi:hypothetical protein